MAILFHVLCPRRPKYSETASYQDWLFPHLFDGLGYLVGSVLFLLLKVLLNLACYHIPIATFLTDDVYLEVRKVGDPQYLAWPG